MCLLLRKDTGCQLGETRPSQCFDTLSGGSVRTTVTPGPAAPAQGSEAGPSSGHASAAICGAAAATSGATHGADGTVNPGLRTGEVRRLAYDTCQAVVLHSAGGFSSGKLAVTANSLKTHDHSWENDGTVAGINRVRYVYTCGRQCIQGELMMIWVLGRPDC